MYTPPALHGIDSTVHWHPMTSEVPKDETTMTVAAADRSTATAGGDEGAAASGLGTATLISHYKAIMQARAIYYPVAYRFVRELGRGRQGVVFQGIRQGARGCTTRHAIKVFDPGIYQNARKYWTDMGRIAAQTSKMQTINSPNLVAPDIYEEYNGVGYVQMEMIDGVGLRYLMDGRHVERAKAACPPDEWARLYDVLFNPVARGSLAIQPGIAVYIMRRVMRGLEILHELGFVHCDIKPANVMVDRLGSVKVIDYGRGTFTNEQQALLLGTPAYMAPEQHRREPASPLADIYAAGLVGLEMLRGKPLLDPKMPEPDMLALKMKLVDLLPDLLPDYVRRNEVFVGVLRKLLNPDPARRYPTAEAADAGRGGLIAVHKQLAQAGKDTEYGRELETYLSKLVDAQTGEVSTLDDMRRRSGSKN